jgi:hypothetical protein
MLRQAFSIELVAITANFELEVIVFLLEFKLIHQHFKLLREKYLVDWILLSSTIDLLITI